MYGQSQEGASPIQERQIRTTFEIRAPHVCCRALRAEWLTSYKADACFWLPVMSANFALVPAQYRVRTVATASMVWEVIIDYLSHRKQPRREEKQA